MKTLHVKLFKIDDPLEVPLYETDTVHDIRIRIAVEQVQPLASILFPIDFEFTTFIKDPSKTEVLDLFSIMPSIQEYKQAKKLYRKIKTRYNCTIDKFTEFMICKQLWDYVSSKKPVSQMIFKQVEDMMTFHWHLDKEEDDILETWWPKDIKYFMDKIKNFYTQMKNDNAMNMVNIANGQKYDAVDPMSIVDEQITGYIIRFMFTTSQTTGELFDQFLTTPDFPVARYKTFYKINLANTKNIKEEPIIPSILHDLQIFNKDGDVNIHVINTPEGLNIQCLLIVGSTLSTPEDIIRFLNLEGNIKSSEQFGVRTQFYIKNMCIDPSVFSDMVINDILFTKFLSVNDTDKISRQNKSVYLYFTDPQSESTFEKEEIYVGGWKRTFSRYGTLTAIINCEIDEGNTYKVCIRILRSVDEYILQSFKNKIGVFMSLYKQNEDSMLKLYKELIPSFTPFKPQYEDIKDKKDPIDILNEAEPRIFVKNIYGVSCQEVKPIIVEDEKVIESLPENKKLMFPPVEFEGIKPRVYTCPGPDLIIKGKPNKLIYPGLKKLPPGGKDEHPFGYVPCCYKEDTWFDTNKKINKKLEKTIKGQDVKEEVKKNIDRPIETNKIIFHLGKYGLLPKDLELFFLCMDPTQQYFRVGVPIHDSFLSCLEYQHSMRNQQPMRTSEEIRAQIVGMDRLHIGLQENYDIGVEGIKAILMDNLIPLDPKRFTRILENFYDVTIYVFSRDKSENKVVKKLKKEEDVTATKKIQIMIPNETRSYYRYDHVLRNVVAIYQHWGGKMNELVKMKDPHCELIVGRQFNNEKKYVFKASNIEWRTLSESCFNFFDGKHQDIPLTINDGILFKYLSGQIIDVLGKTRVYIFKYNDQNIPGFLEHPVAPCGIETTDTFEILSFRRVYKFLSSEDIIPYKIHYYTYFPKLVFVYVKMAQVKLIFPCKITSGELPDTVVKIDDTPPSEILMITSYNQTQQQINFNDYDDKIRLSSILQDYCIKYLSEFMENNKDIIKHQDIDDWMDIFLNEYTTIVKDDHIYPKVTLEDIPIRFNDNVPGLIQNNKVLVAAAVQNKLKYLLKWFIVRKEEVIPEIKLLREIPSYFQHVSNFQKIPNQVIFNTIYKYSQVKHYPYVSTPLKDITTELNSIFYYYNRCETGNEPFIACRMKTKQDASVLLYTWVNKHVIDFEANKNIQDIVVDEPIEYDYVSKLLQWTHREKAIGRIAQTLNNTWIVLMQF